MNPGRAKWLPIWLLSCVLIGALIIGRDRPDNSVEARANSIATGIKCLVCQGLSVNQSKSGSARLIYAEILRQVKDGRTDADIRGYLVGRFGRELLLVPESSGVGSVVWIMPVALTIIAFAGLGVVFARWRRSAATASAIDDLSDLDSARLARARLDQRRAGSEGEDALRQVEAT